MPLAKARRKKRVTWYPKKPAGPPTLTGRLHDALYDHYYGFGRLAWSGLRTIAGIVTREHEEPEKEADIAEKEEAQQWDKNYDSADDWWEEYKATLNQEVASSGTYS